MYDGIVAAIDGAGNTTAEQIQAPTAAARVASGCRRGSGDGYGRQVPELTAPTADLRHAWWQAHAEWGPGQHEDGFGLRDGDEVSTATGFAAWLDRLAGQSDPARTIEVGRHRCTYRWIVENGRVLGGIAVRDGDDAYVSWAGHIGYGIRPSARRRGLGTWVLHRILDEAREQGRDRLLAVCAVDNTASIATLERCGATFDSIRDTVAGPLRRYWFHP